jgi:hypothetical protein
MNRWLLCLALLAAAALPSFADDPAPPAKPCPGQCPQAGGCPAKSHTGIALDCDFGMFKFLIGCGANESAPAGGKVTVKLGCGVKADAATKCCADPAAPCCEGKAPAKCCAAFPQGKAGGECCEAKAAAGCCQAAMAGPCDDAGLCAELMAIIKETDSPDTYTVAVYALTATGGHGKRAIPTVIRNAERLGVLKGLATAKEPTGAQGALLSYLESCVEGRDVMTASCSTEPVHMAPPPMTPGAGGPVPVMFGPYQFAVPLNVTTPAGPDAACPVKCPKCPEKE